MKCPSGGKSILPWKMKAPGGGDPSFPKGKDESPPKGGDPSFLER